ncbi:MAG: hypothetical protein ACREDM_08330 [Methylocella sp.]
MAVLPPLYVLAFVLLKVYEPAPPPPPLIRIDDVQRQASTVKGALLLNVIVANPTLARVNITAAKIELFSGQRPEGGLASAIRNSAKYTVESDANKLIAYSDQSEFRTEVEMTRPYAGNSYTRLTIPLQQQISAGGTDAFLIALGEPALILPEHDTLAVTLHYNGATDSAPREIKLK